MGRPSAHRRPRDVASSGQRVTGELLAAHGREAGAIWVNVLTIDQDPGPV